MQNRYLNSTSLSGRFVSSMHKRPNHVHSYVTRLYQEYTLLGIVSVYNIESSKLCSIWCLWFSSSLPCAFFSAHSPFLLATMSWWESKNQNRGFPKLVKQVSKSVFAREGDVARYVHMRVGYTRERGNSKPPHAEETYMKKSSQMRTMTVILFDVITMQTVFALHKHRT